MQQQRTQEVNTRESGSPTERHASPWPGLQIETLGTLAGIAAVLLTVVYTVGVTVALIAVLDWAVAGTPTWIWLGSGAVLGGIVMLSFMASLFHSVMARVVLTDLVTFRFSFSKTIRRVAERMAAEHRGR